MIIALSPQTSLGHPFFWKIRKPANASRLTVITAPGDTHRIQKGATLVVQRPLGVEIRCLEGSLWITHDGDVKDIMIEPGGSYIADCSSRMLVHALKSAELRMIDRDAKR